MLTREEVHELMFSLRDLKDPELLILKGQMLVERLLVGVLAARLKTDDKKIPRLGFGSLTDLATDDLDDRRKLTWLNDLRNNLAHEFHALNAEPFETLIRRFKLPWPAGQVERYVVLQIIVTECAWLAISREVIHLRATEVIPEETFVEMSESLGRAFLSRERPSRASASDPPKM
jgi:hypothetical protein